MLVKYMSIDRDIVIVDAIIGVKEETFYNNETRVIVLFVLKMYDYFL